MDNITKKYPSVLLVCSSAICNASATGITMENLFRGWPKKKIAQIYDDSCSPNSEICNNYWRVSTNDVPIVGSIKKIVQRVNSFKDKSSNLKVLAKTNENIDGSIKHGIANVWSDMIPLQISKQLWEWIDNFSPEIVYSILGSTRIMRIALQVSKRYAIPIVPHFMDDWPATIYQDAKTHKIPRRTLLQVLKKVLEISPVGLTISDDMAKEYTKRYKLNFTPFMNCAESENRVYKKPIKRGKSTILFGYVGGLHLNRWKSLQQIGLALDKVKQMGQYDVKLIIFAPEKDIARYGHLFEAYSTVSIAGSLMSCQIFDKLEEFDVLVHIESFKEHDQRYTRLSISTKIPQYMSSGRPILAYGPASISSMSYINNIGCGMLVSHENDLNQLINVIEKLASSSSLREKLGTIGFQTALLRHNSKIERDRLRSILLENSRQFH